MMSFLFVKIFTILETANYLNVQIPEHLDLDWTQPSEQTIRANHTEASSSLELLKNRIKLWNFKDCPYNICRPYMSNLGYIN